jgi:hypothetical protein
MSRYLATIGLALTFIGAIILIIVTPVVAQYSTQAIANQRRCWVRIAFGCIALGTTLQGIAIWGE